MTRIRARLTYANAIATIALFVALGGTSIAAIAVTGANVRNESLTGADLKNGTVAGADLRNGSVAGSDLKNGSIGAADIATGAVGAAEIVDGAIGGADIDESTLGTVPNAATLGGRNAVQIVSRARSGAATTSGPVPITGNTWTQAADETDEFFGQITYSGPGGTCMNTYSSQLIVDFQLNGGSLATKTFGGFAAGRFTETFQLPQLIFEPGDATPRTLVAVVTQSPQGCGTATVEDLKLNVAGFR